MRKKGLLLTVCVLFFIFFICGCAQESYQAQGSGAGEKIQIAYHLQALGTLQRPPVVFDHGKHFQVAKEKGCTVCHPVDEEQRMVFESTKAGTSGKSPELLRNAYHQECIGCHKKQKSGPLACGECHVRGGEKVKVTYGKIPFFYYHSKHVTALKEEVESKQAGDTCSLCHHIYDREKRKLVYKKGTEQSCLNCHGPFEGEPPLPLSTEVQLTTEKGLTMQKVGHLRCVNCHLTYTQKGTKAAPVACFECHKDQV